MSSSLLSELFRIPMPTEGPYPLWLMSPVVRPNYAGIYMFTDAFRKVLYVGRSDSDLASRIKESARAGCYTYFYFEYATSPDEAFRKECLYWHRFNPPDNKNHPQVPEGSNEVCDVLGCAHGASLAQLLAFVSDLRPASDSRTLSGLTPNVFGSNAIGTLEQMSTIVELLKVLVRSS